MELHQIQVGYHAEEDRLLLRTSFKTPEGELQEIRAWLTRRMLSLLWGGLIGALETQVALDSPDAAHASADMIVMAHETFVEAMKESGGFGQPYDAGSTTFPLGEAPLLTATVHFSQAAHEPVRMHFVNAQESGFEFSLPLHLLHSFCSMLQDAVKPADWNLELKLPAALSAAGRVMN
ncbi:hypothetical protein E4K72_20075 [Oxalobacteraceae bacterium OM1]|nr:hypothetical protein E4K72_20075 [Oxalobacteraceae bacterium OM1]